MRTPNRRDSVSLASTPLRALAVIVPALTELNARFTFCGKIIDVNMSSGRDCHAGAAKTN